MWNLQQTNTEMTEKSRARKASENRALSLLLSVDMWMNDEILIANLLKLYGQLT